LERQASAAEGLFKTVADRRRLTVLCGLSRGERSDSALGEAMGLNRSALPQKLARLRADGIVAPRRESQTIYCWLESESVRNLIDLLYQLCCAPECGVEADAEHKGEMQR
jgi:DNA-binding transcriptional ArsR family regulator